MNAIATRIVSLGSAMLVAAMICWLSTARCSAATTTLSPIPTPNLSFIYDASPATQSVKDVAPAPAPAPGDTPDGSVGNSSFSIGYTSLSASNNTVGLGNGVTASLVPTDMIYLQTTSPFQSVPDLKWIYDFGFGYSSQDLGSGITYDSYLLMTSFGLQYRAYIDPSQKFYWDAALQLGYAYTNFNMTDDYGDSASGDGWGSWYLSPSVGVGVMLTNSFSAELGYSYYGDDLGGVNVNSGLNLSAVFHY